jgi:hypothetical protein
VVTMRQDNTMAYSIKITVSTLVQGMNIQNIICTYKCVYMTRLQNKYFFEIIVKKSVLIKQIASVLLVHNHTDIFND